MPDAALDLRTLLSRPTSRGHMELMLEAELMESSPEAREYMTESSEAWGVALAASGASDDEVKRAVTNTTAFYVPPAG